MRSRWKSQLCHAGAVAAMTIAIAWGRPLSPRVSRDNNVASVTVAQTSDPVRLLKGTVWVPLRQPGFDTRLTPEVLRSILNGQHLRLVLKDISADAQPGSAFNVYLGLAQAAAPAKDDSHYVGRFSFYNEINAGALKATPSVRTYDITPLVKRLLASGTLGDPVGVTIAPERTPDANANPTIGRIEIVKP